LWHFVHSPSCFVIWVLLYNSKVVGYTMLLEVFRLLLTPKIKYLIHYS
jgi:hypothetical protein